MFKIAFLKAVSELGNTVSLGSWFHSVIVFGRRDTWAVGYV